MSNFLAIAAVTETVRQLLDSAVGNDVPGATATVMRPDKGGAAAAPVANVYLYRVAPSAAFRGNDLPMVRESGEFNQRPTIGLDLHYLLSFFGNDEQLEPQRLMGSAVRTLHARSVLTRQMITDALASTPFGFLAASDLGVQPDLVKLSPAMLTLDELSKLWSVFFQTPYTLSIGYEATVVCIEQDEPAPTPMPVKRFTLRVDPFGQPLITSVTPTAGDRNVILASSSLRITGERLMGDDTKVRIAGDLIDPISVSPTEIVVDLTTATALRSGVQGLQVVHQVLFGTAGDPHKGNQSAVTPIVLRPVISNPVPTASTLTLTVDPPVRAGQRAVLFLNRLTGAEPKASSFTRPPTKTDDPAPTFTDIDLPAGSYLIRIQIDGAESALEFDPNNPNDPPVGPKVNLP